MRKRIIVLGAVMAVLTALLAYPIATGTVAASSIPVLFAQLLGWDGPAADEQTVAQHYRVADGFVLELYASDLPKVRFMRITGQGDLIATRSHKSDVVLLRRDADGDGSPDAVETLIEGLSRPHGLDLRDGWLYVGERERIGRIQFDSETGTTKGEYEVIIEGLTGEGNHWSKTIAFGPDGYLYVAQGSTCNVCEESDVRRATIMRFDADGQNGEIIATGLRNAVGFDWAPWDGALYATDNGRDLLGDDFPACELNRVVDGGYYGWPYYNNDNVPDPSMGPDPLVTQRSPIVPEHNFRPHNAPLGIVFPETNGWPAGYERSALVALHGSWNRSSPDGYKVVSLHWGEQGIEERDFVTGFLTPDESVNGRPVDVAQGPDGSIYISDDYGGAIFRVRPGKADAGTALTIPAVTEQLGDVQPPEWLTNLDPAQLETMKTTGAQLYSQYACAGCHEVGENPLLLDGLASRSSHTRVMELLEAPPPPMPVIPVDEAGLRALAVYLLDTHQ